MARSIEDILRDEGDALRSGRFDDLAALAEERDAALAVLDAHVSADEGAIRALAARNMRLAEAAAKGLRLARTRMVAIARGATLETYSADGHRHEYRDTGSSLQKRA